MLGGLRGVAQTISYEIRLALIILSVLILMRAISLDVVSKLKEFYRVAVISPIIFLF
jgi:NADH:ubiquinone oxidoreductase subunit H